MYKKVTISIGILFLLIGLIIIINYANDMLSYIAAFSIGGLGIEAIYSALKNRRSILSKIGPLP